MVGPEDLVFAPVVLPLLGAAVTFCAKAFLKNAAAKVMEYTGVFIGLALPWLVFIHTAPIVLSGDAIQGVIGNWHADVGIMYRFDGLSWLVNLLGFSVGGAAWIYSLGAGPRGPEFSTVFLILFAAIAATSMAVDLFNLFVCLEVMGMASYVLIADSDKHGAVLAAFSYLMVSSTAMVFFLLGFYGFYRLTGSISYEGIAIGLRNLPDAGGAVASISMVLVVSAVLIRVAVMPLHNWLPDAHAMASHAVSAILSGVLIKIPLFALSRVVSIMPDGAKIGQLMGYAGAVTAVAAVVAALSQKDAKRLLAYHSISQIGYVVSAWGMAVHVGISSETGIALMSAAFLHAFYHALFKALLFLSVGTTIDRTAERNVYALRGAASTLRASGEKLPITLISFLIGALSISAIPPFNGYASKAALSYAMEGSPHQYLLTAASVGTVASFIKLSRIYLPQRKPAAIRKNAVPKDMAVSHGPVVPPKRVHWAIHLSQGFLGVLCILGGVAAPDIHAFVMRLLSASGNYTEPSLILYSREHLMKTLITTVLGIVLFFLATTKPGSAFLKALRERPYSFQGMFVSFSLSVVVLAAWLLV